MPPHLASAALISYAGPGALTGMGRPQDERGHQSLGGYRHTVLPASKVQMPAMVAHIYEQTKQRGLHIAVNGVEMPIFVR